MKDDPQSSNISNSGVQEVSILRWKSMKNQIRVCNEVLRTSQLGLLIDPKGDSSVSKVVQQMTLKYYNGGKLYSSHIEGDSTPGYVNRHTPIGNEGKSCNWYKR
jgi:hypothetical protein